MWRSLERQGDDELLCSIGTCFNPVGSQKRGFLPVMSIETVLENLVTSNEPGAIVLQGRWGVGKTYFWRQQIIGPALIKLWKTRYSYVSLFGINSLEELKMALAFATDEFDQAARVRTRRHRELFGWFWKAKDWTVKKFWKNTGWLSDALVSTPKVGASVAKLYQRAAFYMVRQRIICFDDIERHGKNLDIKDFLGLISYLVDQRACRVVVILNSKELGEDQTVWDAMREKVFDGELTYKPSLSETVALGLSEVRGESWYDVMRSSLETLCISNIRLVRRTVRFMRLTVEVCPATSLQPATVEHMVRALVVLVYSVHGRGEGAPPIEMVMQSGSYNPLIAYMRKGKESKTEQEQLWAKMLEGYPLSLNETLDNALLDMVEAGYPNAVALSSAIEQFEAEADLRTRKRSWEEAWRLYHDTTAENGRKMADAFEQTWPPVSEAENAINLQSLARLLRLLGRHDLATQFIQKWIAQRGGERIGELDVSEISKFSRIDDQEILEEAAKAREAANYDITLQAAFDIIKDEPMRYDDRAIASFSRASPQEIARVIDANPDRNLQSVIKRLLTLPQNPNQPLWGPATENMRRACEIIAARSPLNADRMSNWFGITAVPAASNSEPNREPDG